MAIQDDIAAYQAQQQQPAPTNDINADIAAYQQNQQAAPISVSNNPVVPEGQDWTTAGGKVVGGQQEPGFIKKLDMIASGVDRGVKNFTLALMSKLPFGEKYQNAIKQVDADATAVQEYNKKNYGGLYPGIGEVGGELLATLPAGGALGGVAKGAKLLGEVLPTGLKTIGKYGTSALGGAGVLAGVESQKYDPENPGQLINTEKAGEALSNPLSYALPMAATKLGTWGEAAQKLGVAKEEFPNIMARNLKEGPTQKLSDMFFNIPATLTGVGKQAKQVEGIGDDISSFIMKTAGTKEAQTADNLREYSANIIQSTLKKMGRAEDKIWDKGFKSTLISDAQAVKDDVINAIDLLKTNKVPGYDTVVNSLNNGIRKGDLKVEDVKKLQTIMSGAAINAKSLEGGIGNELASSLGGIKDNLLNHIQNSLSPDAMKDFIAAKAFSANKFELFKNAPLLQKAINDEASAHKLVNSLISEGGVLPPKKAVMGILSGKGQDMVAATKVQQALESADNGSGHIDLDKFLKATSPYTQSKEILNKDAYQNLVGLNKYIKTVKESGNVGRLGQVATGAALAGGAGAGAMGMGTIGMALPLIGYGAASFVANHSPLKSLMYAVTKNLPKNTMDLVTKNIEKHLTRAGYFMSEDGVFKHKDDKDVTNKGIQ